MDRRVSAGACLEVSYAFPRLVVVSQPSHHHTSWSASLLQGGGMAGSPPPPHHHHHHGPSSLPLLAGGGGGGSSSTAGGGVASADQLVSALGNGGGGGPPHSTGILQADRLFQNLSQSVVISPSIALLSIQPDLRPLVPVAVDRAIREIISAVVERSGTYVCTVNACPLSTYDVQS